MSFKKRILKILVITTIIIALIAGGGYLYILKKIADIKTTISGSTIETENFKEVIAFEYINSWIVVKVKVDGSDKEYDFIFDTGAQTVFSDSLMKEIGSSHFKIFSVHTDTSNHAFRNEIISLNGLSLSNVKFSNIGALIVDNSEYGMLNCVSPWGIIGYNVLQNCCWQIDYEKKQITITDQIDSLTNLRNIDWIKYTTISQETPVIPAVINDSIHVNLFFDTGYSGAINLSSANLFKTVSHQYPNQIANYSVKPSIVIAGGRDVASYQKMQFKTSTFSLGALLSNDLIITVEDVQEKKYSGLIGNKYFENYIITLDYKNKRVGFKTNTKSNNQNTKTTYGISYTTLNDQIFVNVVYRGSVAETMGIKVGDEIFSINGITIADLPTETFCKIYRSEYKFGTDEDSLMLIEVVKNGDIIKYELEKYKIF